MKLGKSVLLEIVAIVQEGLVNGSDVSQALRSIDLEVVEESDTVELSEAYLEVMRKKEE